MAGHSARYPNRLKAVIKHVGLTEKEVAQETNIPLRTLSDYCAGKVPIPRKRLEDIAQVIGCEPADLVPAVWEKSAGLLPAVNSFINMEQTTSEKLDQAESILNLAWEAWFASRPKQAMREAVKLLPGLERMLFLPLAALHVLRAKALAIRCHGLLGALYLDALQNDAAFYHYTQAHRLAEEIRDTNLIVTYLALIGDVLRRQNDKTGAISSMEQARDQGEHAAPATRGHVLQLLAYTYADTGNENAFERTIAEATDLLAFTGEGEDITKTEFIPFEIYEIRGKANRDLGKPLQAIPYLKLAEKSLSKAETVTPRWHALLEISRGQAFCDAGDLTIGVDLASKGFLMAAQCQSPRQMNRVRKLLRKLEESQVKNERKVHELRELLHETYLHRE